MRAWIVAALGAGLVLAACGTPSPSSICDEICDCQGCKESEQEDCVADLEKAEGDAEDKGCGDAYDAYASCLGDDAQCDGDRYDAGACQGASASLAACIGKPVLPGVSACAALEVCCQALEKQLNDQQTGGTPVDLGCEVYREASPKACAQALDAVVGAGSSAALPPECRF
jgi:hypothetical protein